MMIKLQEASKDRVFRHIALEAKYIFRIEELINGNVRVFYYISDPDRLDSASQYDTTVIVGPFDDVLQQVNTAKANDDRPLTEGSVPTRVAEV